MVTVRLDGPDRSLVQIADSLDNPVGGLIAVRSVPAPTAGRVCIGSPRAANARKEWTLDVHPRRLYRQTGVDGMERCWSDGNVECPSTARSHPDLRRVTPSDSQGLLGQWEIGEEAPRGGPLLGLSCRSKARTQDFCMKSLMEGLSIFLGGPFTPPKGPFTPQKAHHITKETLLPPLEGPSRRLRSPIMP